jgi:hypothetical protein
MGLAMLKLPHDHLVSRRKKTPERLARRWPNDNVPLSYSCFRLHDICFIRFEVRIALCCDAENK